MLILFYAHSGNIPDDDLKAYMDSIAYRHADKWMELKKYLLEEGDQGKREFRISMQSDTSFLIHPLGDDGLTMDFEF